MKNFMAITPSFPNPSSRTYSYTSEAYQKVRGRWGLQKEGENDIRPRRVESTAALITAGGRVHGDPGPQRHNVLIHYTPGL